MGNFVWVGLAEAFPQLGKTKFQKSNFCAVQNGFFMIR